MKDLVLFYLTYLNFACWLFFAGARFAEENYVFMTFDLLYLLYFF